MKKFKDSYEMDNPFDINYYNTPSHNKDKNILDDKTKENQLSLDDILAKNNMLLNKDYTKLSYKSISDKYKGKNEIDFHSSYQNDINDNNTKWNLNTKIDNGYKKANYYNNEGEKLNKKNNKELYNQNEDSISKEDKLFKDDDSNEENISFQKGKNTFPIKEENDNPFNKNLKNVNDEIESKDIKDNKDIKDIKENKENIQDLNNNNFSDIKVSNPFSKGNFYNNINNDLEIQISKYRDPNKVTKEQLNYLPLESQIKILLEKNEILSKKLAEYEQYYGNLKEDKDDDKFSTLLEKENENLKGKLRKQEETLKQFVKFINNVKEKLHHDPIGMEDLYKDNNSTYKMLNSLQNEILNHIKRSIKKEKKTEGQQGLSPGENDLNSELSDDNLTSEQYMQRVINRNPEDQGHYYNYHSNEKIGNCEACELGFGNSQKGYSPLMCSPNRLKYILVQEEEELEDDSDSI